MPAPPRDALRWLRKQQAPARPWIAAAIAAGLGAVAASIAQAGWLAELLSTAALAPAQLAPVTGLLVLALLLALRAGCIHWRHRAAFEAGRAVRVAARAHLLDRLADLPRARRPPVGSGTTLLLEQVEALDGYYAHYLPQSVLSIAAPLGIVAMIWPRSWVAAAILLFTAPLIPLFMVLVGSRARAASEAQFEQLQRLGGHFLDLLRGLPTLKLLGAARPQQAGVAQAADAYSRRVLGVLRLAFLSTAVLELVASVAIAMLALYLGLTLLGRLPVEPALSLEDALFILLLAPEFYAPLRALGQHYHARAHALGAAEALRGFDTQGADGATVAAGAAAPMPGLTSVALEFSGVHVDYPDGRAALAGVDLRLPAGARAALVGASGAGKTTLLDLTLGLLAPTRGEVRVNGVELRSLARDRWHASLAWIGQRPEWLAGSLRENIRLGRPGADDAAVSAAADAAGVSAFAAVLPQGLDTALGEDGLGLSGGQLQRLAIARALLRDAPLWVLDEPTAHLDLQTEQEIFATLAQVTRGRTVLLATHRVPPPQLAERVLTLEQGRLRADQAHVGMAIDDDEAVAAARGTVAPPAHADPALLDPMGTPGSRAARASLRAALRRHLGLLALTVALGAITLAAGVGLLAISGWFLTAAAVAGAAGVAASFDIFRPGALVRLAAVLRTGGRYAERLVGHDATLRLLADLRVWAFGQIEPRCLDRRVDADSGDALQRLLGDIDALDGLWLRAAAPWVQAVPVILLLIAGLWIGLGGVVAFWAGVLLAAVMLVTPLWAARRSAQAGARLASAQARLRSRAAEALRSLTSLQVYGAWPATQARLLALGEDWVHAQQALNRIEARALGGGVVLAGGAALVTLALGSAVVAQGDLPGPWLAAAVLALLGLAEGLAPLAAGFVFVGQQRLALQRLEALAATPPRPGFPAQGVARPLRADYRLRDVAFAYPGRVPILAGLDLDLPQGRHIALLGPNGAGKSTLAALLARACDPTAGAISLGGQPLAAYDEATLRRLVTLVPQHAHVFDLTLAENLRLAAPAADEAALLRALEVVQLADWVRAQPLGLATRAGGGGAQLSGGQARRLALARALLVESAVLILDEPTEGLDGDTAQRLITALRAGCHDRTLVVITHRRSLARAFDAIWRLSATAGGAATLTTV